MNKQFEFAKKYLDLCYEYDLYLSPWRDGTGFFIHKFDSSVNLGIVKTSPEDAENV